MKTVLTNYIHAAMCHANYEKLDDGTFYGEIPQCKGIWSKEDTLEHCRKVLQEVLEEWIVLKLQDGDTIPPIDGIKVTVGAA